MRTKIFKRFSFGTIGTLIGILLSIGAITRLYYDFFFDVASETLLAVGVVSFFGIYFFGLHQLTKNKYERSSSYPELFDQLNKGFREIHWLQRKSVNEVNYTIVISVLEEICRNLANGFHDITGTKCCACIKILTADDKGDIVYETLCRNTNADNKRFKADNDAYSKDIRHSIDKNTAFSVSLNSNDEYFFSNYLPFDQNYENSSFQIYGDPHKGRNPISRYFKWNLPYKSTIVVPIKPLPRVPVELDNNGDCYGFLCIDSNSLEAFDKKYDPYILKGVADGIYNSFSKFSIKLSS